MHANKFIYILFHHQIFKHRKHNIYSEKGLTFVEKWFQENPCSISNCQFLGPFSREAKKDENGMRRSFVKDSVWFGVE